MPQLPSPDEIGQLDARHDELLRKLAELEQQVARSLAEFTSIRSKLDGKPAEAPATLPFAAPAVVSAAAPAAPATRAA